MGRRPEVTLALIAGIILILIGFTVMPHLVFLIPACVALAAVARGPRSAILLSVGFSLLAIWLVGETGWLVPFLCTSGFILAWGLRSRRGPLEIILVTGVSMAVAVVAWFVVGAHLSGESLREGLGIWLQELRTGLLSDIAGLPRDEQEAVIQRFDTFVQLVWPASLLLSSLFAAGMNYVVTRWVLQRFDVAGLSEWPPFSRWRLSWGYTWGVIGGLGALLLAEVSGDRYGPGIATVGLNLSMVSFVVFLVQGLAVVWYWLSKTNMGRGLRLALVVFALLTVLLPPIITLIGIFDSWLDWRRLEKRGQAGDKAGV